MQLNQPPKVPVPPFHPACRVYPAEKVIRRCAELKSAGDELGAVDLLHAFLSALSYPNTVLRESVKLELIPAPPKGAA